VSRLHAAVDKYLALRRSLGFLLRDYDQRLHGFVTFVERRGSIITTALVISWITRHRGRSALSRINLLCEIRGFARYWSASDPRTQVPPGRLMCSARRRRPAYLYTGADIRRLMIAALKMRSASHLWPKTLATIVGLLATTGMRVSEASALNDDDIDWEDQVLNVRHAKFGKSRLVPVHTSTLAALASYIRERNSCTRPSFASPLFPSAKGLRLGRSTVYAHFRILLAMVGLRQKNAHHGPRLHDLRHRFAVNTLVRAYRADVDPERRMYILSTYLGHVGIESTFWYMSAVPELMAEARKRLERRLGKLP
jgi:integrase/recombinase XerD